MIARLWSARATPQNWPAYEKYFIDHVVPGTSHTERLRRRELAQREDGDEVAITVLTFWRSLESLDAFAGTDREAAVVAPNVTAFLSSFDKRVQHFDLAFADTPFDLTF